MALGPQFREEFGLDEMHLSQIGLVGIGGYAGAVLNAMEVRAGLPIAVFGTGTVGMAAIMAAKGIVRFPEISRDARSHEPKGGPPGASAEEFLIGSLASWTLAAGAGLLVHLALTAR